MTTRLDRLFLLLDTGSTPLIRKSAAEQLGDVQKLHPYELNNLLPKVHTYLKSSSWETRIAASQAVTAIARHVPQWEPRGAPKTEGGVEGVSLTGKLCFSRFDLAAVLARGTSLLGSEGEQFNQDDKMAGLDEKEKLVYQRQLLNKRLGLDMAGSLKLGLDGDLFSDEDLLVGMKREQPQVAAQDLRKVSELVQQQISANLSSRELNRAKRKAKLLAKQTSRDTPSPDLDGEPPVKKSKPVDQESDPTDSLLEMEETEWPFEWFCELLMVDLFSSAWETRHGAATGLREVIKLHGRGAAKAMHIPADQMSGVNQLWLSDLALRLLCVIALDRFGDFVSDEVVAPVRETCAQTLGVVMKYLEAPGIHGVLSILLQLLAQPQWEVRHGGLLGIRYLLAIRKDMTNELLPCVLPHLHAGIRDVDDDVRAVAASALVPVVDNFVLVLPHQVPVIVGCLWEILLDLDDLTASTNSIMTLLSALLAHPDTRALDTMSRPLTELVPRLFPFLKHNIASVRKSALDTLHTLLNLDSTQLPGAARLPPLLPALLRHCYQRALLETQTDILALLRRIWACLLGRGAALGVLCGSAAPWLGVWLALAMQPPKLPYENTYLIEAKHRGRIDSGSHKARGSLEAEPGPGSGETQTQAEYIAGGNSLLAGVQDRDAAVIRARTTAARMLGELCHHITQSSPAVTGPSPAGAGPFPTVAGEQEPTLDALVKLLVFHLGTRSAIQRLVIAEVVHQWASAQGHQCPAEVTSKVLEALNETIYFDEITVGFTRLQTDCRDFIASLKQQGVNMDEIIAPGSILSLDQASLLVGQIYEQVKSTIKPRHLQTIEDRRSQLTVSVHQIVQDQQSLAVRVQSSLAKAAVMLDAIPEKLNPVIRPLMDCVKKEENPQIQREAAVSLTLLLKKCASREPSPNTKVVKNLCGFLCCDPASTPVIAQLNNNQTPEASSCDPLSGNLTLVRLNKVTEFDKKSLRRTPSVKNDVTVTQDMLQEDAQLQQSLSTQRRGGQVALSVITDNCGENLPSELPTLWETVTKCLALETGPESGMTEAGAQETVTCLQVLETIGPSLHKALLPRFITSLPCLRGYLSSRYTGVRHMAARCIAMVARLETQIVMAAIIEDVIPMLESAEDDIQRQGASEAIANVIDGLGLEIVPYIVLLIVPVLGRMSDQNHDVRTIATHYFAMLIQLLPLEAGVPNPPDMKSSFIAAKLKERAFLEQLMDGSKLEKVNVQVPIKADLRSYQQDGVNWLGFLNKYKLHGVLCDDMGLGKTLQSICIIASDTHSRQQKYKTSPGPDCTALPSIVVCPPTLIGHWVYEIEKFIDKQYLNPLMYAGPPAERIKLQKKAKKHNLIVASYDVVRNDIDFFGNINWNYCVLDEGHIIKNGKTKISRAVKQLRCAHRLILSGTPIQNNVLDLWSLFDFLMPGFLGSERQFQARYGKPILASREAKSSSREQEAGALAMETLHRPVLPFVLRRLKEDVLKDLPPKIIQDYYCDLSPLQVKLYEDFAKSQAQRGVEECVHSPKVDQTKKSSTHVFQALQYLRKVSNHPALVLNVNHPRYSEVTASLKSQGSLLHDLTHAPKLTALRQLLNDCGIGVDESSGGQAGMDCPVVNQHRVLLFCQLKGMLDIVEKDLLKTHMPTVTYLRMDGSVPAGSRHDLVNRFNNDPSIDLLLLTTHVGGLGLNLTGADTVIFVEHDWNPMKDLQAMDRAHRIGQKKVVNVYRLITRGTLEEKIMGLQKFKMTIANTVISQDNSSLQSMGTDQLLDLFTLEDKKKGESSAPGVGGFGEAPGGGEKPRETVKSILEGLGELWGEEQYQSEYDMQAFMKSLAK